MDAGIEVKVEDYDGTYVCLFCGESVRGQPALKCSNCSSKPFHLACVALAHSKYAEVCPTCDRKTVETWGSASGGTAAPSEMIDLRELESEGEGAGEVVALTGNGARAAAVPAVGGTVVADVVGQVARGGRAEAGGSSSGKGKEPAEADGGPKAGGDVGGATSAGAGAVGSRGKGKGKGRAGHGPARDERGGSGRGESSGGGRGKGRSEHIGGSGGRRAAVGQSGEGIGKRAAPDGDEGGSSGGVKRARAGKPGQCEHNRQRSQCKECGGEGICQHNRIRSECKECGGGGICQHARRRSRCKTCKADKDESMPPDLEEL